MRIAVIDNKVVIAEPGELYDKLSKFMKWNKRTKRLEAALSEDLLLKLSGLFTLPPRMAAELQRLQAKQAMIDHIRAEEEPKPLMEFPVKAKLYKHQIKAVNMALVEFDVLGGDANDSTSE